MKQTCVCLSVGIQPVLVLLSLLQNLQLVCVLSVALWQLLSDVSECGHHDGGRSRCFLLTLSLQRWNHTNVVLMGTQPTRTAEEERLHALYSCRNHQATSSWWKKRSDRFSLRFFVLLSLRIFKQKSGDWVVQNQMFISYQVNAAEVGSSGDQLDPIWASITEPVAENRTGFVLQPWWSCSACCCRTGISSCCSDWLCAAWFWWSGQKWGGFWQKERF